MYSELNEVINASPEAPRYNISYPTELYSEILPGLWIGGTDDFDTIYEATPYTPTEETPLGITAKDFDAWVKPENMVGDI